jgi:hypothetical protein
MMRAVIIAVVVLLLPSLPAVSETIYCARSFQGYEVCQGAGGYRSTEWSRDGRTFGQDSDGSRWMTSRWRDGTITTVEPER